MAVYTQMHGSVGQGGTNKLTDVIRIQTLLNEHLHGESRPRRLVVSGIVDALTIEAIKTFQRNVVGLARPDGRVDPNGPTLRMLTNQSRVAVRRSLPPFETLWRSYPAASKPCDQGYENQCAIRMSVTAISAGFPLTGYREHLCRHGHARGAEALARYLAQSVRPPERAKKEAARRLCAGRTGVVFFRNIEGFRNSQGDHIDLWDRTKTKGGQYFMVCEEVWFWAAP